MPRLRGGRSTRLACCCCCTGERVGEPVTAILGAPELGRPLGAPADDDADMPKSVVAPYAAQSPSVLMSGRAERSWDAVWWCWPAMRETPP